jgi:hypothetical protein
VEMNQLPPRHSGDEEDLLARLDASSGFAPRVGVWDD